MHPVAKLRESVENLVATIVTLGVVAYFAATLFMGMKLDFKIPNIPPETYAGLLFALWALLQRSKGNALPVGGRYERFWRWQDKWEAGLMSCFLLVAVVWSIAKNINVSFSVMAMSFLVYALYDWYDNVRRRVVGGTGSGASIPGLDMPQRVEQNIEVVMRVKRLVEMPDGTLVPWDPTKLIDAPRT